MRIQVNTEHEIHAREAMIEQIKAVVDDYIDAYEDMLNATSHELARWHLVPADRNWYRDHVIARAVVSAMEDLKMKWPKPEHR